MAIIAATVAAATVASAMLLPQASAISSRGRSRVRQSRSFFRSPLPAHGPFDRWPDQTCEPARCTVGLADGVRRRLRGVGDREAGCIANKNADMAHQAQLGRQRFRNGSAGMPCATSSTASLTITEASFMEAAISTRVDACALKMVTTPATAAAIRLVRMNTIRICVRTERANHRPAQQAAPPRAARAIGFWHDCANDFLQWCSRSFFAQYTLRRDAATRAADGHGCRVPALRVRWPQ